LLKPRVLQPGARVALVAPASPFERDEFERGVAELRRLGFEPVYDSSVFDRVRYVAGSAETRASALRRAWTDPSVGAIMAVRGGYGSAQVLPLLDAGEVREARKPFVGYSDLTALLTFHAACCGLVAFHGPMLVSRLSRGSEGYDRHSLLAAVSSREPMGEMAPPQMVPVHGGEAGGLLLGGTVTQLLASLATPFAFDPPPGYVLFFDEIGERPYRLDRMVTQLKQAGLLSRASAIVIGELPKCEEPSGNPTAAAVMAEALDYFPGPVVMGFPSGHTGGPPLTLPFGVNCRVIAEGRPRLVIEEGAVDD
jgi:muramoyltetrapeptide carboxypeptidase